MLLWQRDARAVRGQWALPGGGLPADRAAARGDPRPISPPRSTSRDVAYLEQLATHSAVDARSARARARDRLSRARPGRRRRRSCPPTPPGSRSTTCRRPRSTTTSSSRPQWTGCAPSSSYTNIGFALAPEEFTIAELRDIISAALGYRVERDQPGARPHPPQRDRGDGTACGTPGQGRRAPGDRVPVREPTTHGHRSVRRAQATARARNTRVARVHRPGDVIHRCRQGYAHFLHIVVHNCGR